jgi:thioredoxin
MSRARAQQPVCARCHTPLPVDADGRGGGSADSRGPREITDDSFQAELVAAGDRPVLVDCWAEWCPPCRMLAPTIDQLAAESAGRWVIVKLDVDHNPRTAGQFRVGSIPTLLIFKHGQLVDQLVGLQPKPNIVAALERHGG